MSRALRPLLLCLWLFGFIAAIDRSNAVVSPVAPRSSVSVAPTLSAPVVVTLPSAGVFRRASSRRFSRNLTAVVLTATVCGVPEATGDTASGGVRRCREARIAYGRLPRTPDAPPRAPPALS